MSAAAGAAAAAAAIAQATLASGAIVKIDPNDFARLLYREKGPLVVCATGGFFTTTYKYLTSYKGLIFFTTSTTPLRLPDDCERVDAKAIWVPH